MPYDGVVIKLVVGVVFALLIVGIFLIISAINEKRRIDANNHASDIAISFSDSYLLINSIDNEEISITPNQIEKLVKNYQDDFYYLFLTDKTKYRLGNLNRVEVENFIKAI